MANHTLPEFKYELDTVTRNAPTISGIFMIYSRNRCVYVGESDDICGSLLEIYFDANPCLAEQELTHFTFEPASPESRVHRQAECIREFGPACNLRAGFPDCGDCRLARGAEPHELVRVSSPI